VTIFSRDGMLTAAMSGHTSLCANCKTERYGIYCRVYCHRCYPLILRKEQVERWDLNSERTLKTLPSIVRQYPGKFSKIKSEVLKETDYRLWLIKTRERQRKEKVSGLDIEHALQRLARFSGGSKEAVNIVMEANRYFDAEQLQVLLGWLLDIEESRRWRRKDYWCALLLKRPSDAIKDKKKK
jgi:hypothetical protein